MPGLASSQRNSAQNLTATTTTETSKKELTITDIFCQWVASNPDAIALEDLTVAGKPPRHRVTYQELHVASDVFSQRLRNHGVKAGDVVPVLGKRSVDMVVAVLAILKLRACYVPFDLDSWGSDRIKSTLDLIDCNVVVSELPIEAHESHQVILIDNWSVHGKLNADVSVHECAIKSQIRDTRSDNWTLRDDDLAYIIFTSGTTGVPKGVMVAQRSITAYVQAGDDLPFNLGAHLHKRVLLICSMAFDACAGILFSTLCNGATLVLADPATMTSAIKSCHIVPLTPSILSTLDSEEESAVETILLGGEAPSSSLITAWSSRGRKIFNAYGPTETTCTALMAELRPDQPVLIGRPIHYSEVVLIDEDGKEADEGELYISGLGVAVGYYRSDVLTAAAFVIRKGKRFFKTGDFGRHTADGMMLLGRRDSFIKNRGFLINLDGDVEPALHRYPGVQAAVALQFEGRLYGIVTPMGASNGLRDFLRETVSTFIIPDVLLSIESLPQTANDKVDRKALVRLISESKRQSESPETSSDLSPMAAVLWALSQVFDISVQHMDQFSSFRDLGGHSLAAVLVVSKLRKLSYFISVAAVLQQDTVSKISAAVKHWDVMMPNFEDIQQRSRELKDLIGASNPSDLELQEISPMTDMQLRMVRTSMEKPSQNFIKAGMTFQHKHPETLNVLRSSWQQVLRRHSIFRTSYQLSVANGLQLIHLDEESRWQEVVVSEQNWGSVCEKAELFDLKSFSAFDETKLATLSNFQIITVPGIRTRLVWTVHHSLLDGWSISHLLSELQAISDGQSLDAAPQFSEAAYWIQLIEENSREAAKLFWSRNLHGISPDCRMKVKHGGTKSLAQLEQSVRLSIKISDLNAFALRSSVTSASIIYSAWAVLLSRYTGTNQVVFGAVLAGRNVPISGIEKVVGPLMNTLPFAVKLDENISISRFLSMIFASLCELSDFQWSSNATILGATGTKGTDFFETILALQYDFPQISSQWKTLTEPTDIQYSESTEAPLTVIVDGEDGFLKIRYLYKCSAFSEEIISRLMGHFANILETILYSPTSSLLHVASNAMMGSAELLSCVQNSTTLDLPYEGPSSVQEVLNTCIGRFPDHIAVEHSNGQLTYRDLGVSTNQIAGVLGQTVAKGDIVCLFTDGSVQWIQAIVAVIRCGAAYCPIDIRLPVERQRIIIAESGCSIAIASDHRMLGDLPELPGVTILTVDILLENSSHAVTTLERSVSKDDLVCVVFTSGSTGTPKGIKLQNIGILSLLAYPPGRLHSAPGQRNAQLLSVGFDGCVKEVFATLCHGATLVLKDPEDPLAHLSNVDATMITPSLLNTLHPQNYMNLKIINLVGEAVPQSLVEKWGHGRVLQNGYGPAECTIVCLYADLIPSKRVTIGRPVPRLACYILDELMRPCPYGVAGELYLSGVQVTRGYLSSSSGAVSRFLENPFRPGWRMYRTGDQVRWSESGEIEYIGREDDQVKLRGFRIDLGDVEASILEVDSQVVNSAVIATDGKLVAFIAPMSVDTASLKTILKEKLPHYSQVSRIIKLAALPLSANQKVNRKALLAMDLPSQNEFEELSTDTERIIADIWKVVLAKKVGAPDIGALDHFFDLGGHSLLQIRVAQQITSRLGLASPLKLVIRNHVLRDLSSAVNKSLRQKDPDLTLPFSLSSPISHSEYMPLSHLENELYFNYLLADNKTALNLPFAVRIIGTISIRDLSQAFETVVSSNNILRSQYLLINGTPFRKTVQQGAKAHFEVADSNLSRMVQQQVDLPFDLESGEPIRILFISEHPRSTIMILTMTHMIGDRTTLNQILTKVGIEYSNIKNERLLLGETLHTATPALGYVDWTAWSNLSHSDNITTEFWRDYLGNLTPHQIFLKDQKVGTFEGSSRYFTLKKSLSRRLLRICSDASVTAHHMALTAIGMVLHALTRSKSVVVGAPYGNRMEPGTEQIMGLFLDRLPIRLLSGDEDVSIIDIMKKTRASSQDAMAHFLPYQQICKSLEWQPAESGPLFEVMVTYHMADEASSDQLKLDGCNTEIIRAHPQGAKYPLMFEFSEVDSKITVDIEYDTGLIAEDYMDSIESALTVTLELIGMQCSSSAIAQCLENMNLPKAPVANTTIVSMAPACNCSGTSCKVSDVIVAVAECLGIEPDKIDRERSIFEMGISSTNLPMLQYLFWQRGVSLTLREILKLQTVDQLIHVLHVTDLVN